jgi:hypothetical protein
MADGKIAFDKHQPREKWLTNSHVSEGEKAKLAIENQIRAESTQIG